MGKTRGSGRTCPDCLGQVPSSSKICFCGGSLATRRSSSSATSSKKSSTALGSVKIRRTERIKRGKPDYYDPLEYERQQKKERKRRTSSGRVTTIPTQFRNGKTNKEPEANFTSHRMHLKTKKKKKKIEVEPPKEEELEEIILSKETIAKFALILEEINRKIYASSWRVYID